MLPQLLSSRRDVTSGDLIFRLDAAARERAATGAHVINGTVGALLDDDGRLVVLNTVMDLWRKLTPTEIAPYAPIVGDPAYLLAFVQRFWPSLSGFGVAAASPGGSGALALTLRNLLEPGQTLVTAEPYWSPYATLAAEAGMGLVTVPFPGAGEALDIGAWEQTLRDVLDEQGRLMLWLNEPCNNPTGRSLSHDDRRTMLAMLRDISSQGPVTLILDLAYFDYPRDPADTEQAMADYAEFGAEGSVLLGASVSLSKSFTIYGARAGALVFPWCDDAALQKALAGSCRGMWSNCARAPMSVFKRLAADPAAKAELATEHAYWRGVLSNRARALDTALRAEGLPGAVWDGGFFVMLSGEPDPFQVSDRLQTHDVFVVPTEHGLRTGICGLKTTDAPRFAAAYKAALMG